MKKLIVTVFLGFICTYAYSAPLKSVTGTINKVQIQSKNYTSYSTSGEAIVFIHMDELPIACGNVGGYRRVAITSNHPAFNAVVSGALAAKASQAQVHMFYLEECTLWNQNAWDISIFNIL